MSYLQAINYDQYFDMGQKYQHKFFMLPKDLPLESFVIEIDEEDEDEVDDVEKRWKMLGAKS